MVNHNRPAQLLPTTIVLTYVRFSPRSTPGGDELSPLANPFCQMSIEASHSASHHKIGCDELLQCR
jgi:hypothetical protein